MRVVAQARWKLLSAGLFTIIIFLELQALQNDTPSSTFFYHPENISSIQDSYVEPLVNTQRAHFELPERISSPDGFFINVGMIVINIKKTENLSLEFRWKLERNLGSILDYSSGTPLHFIIITDSDSLASVSQFFSQFLGKYVAKNVIKTLKWKKRKLFPFIKLSFVDIKEIIKMRICFTYLLCITRPSYYWTG
jgi:hypothetical protein